MVFNLATPEVITPPPGTAARQLVDRSGALPLMQRALRLTSSLQMVELLDSCCASDVRLSLAWGSQWTGQDGVRSYLARSVREQHIESMTIKQAVAGEQAFSYVCELQRSVPRLRQRWRTASMWVYRVREDRIGEMEHFSGPVDILDGDPGRGFDGDDTIPVLGRLRGDDARRWLADRWADAGGR